MEENSVRSNQTKRGSDEIRRDEATLEEKRQKKVERRNINKAYGEVVASMKKKDAKGADEAFSRYVDLAGSVKPEVMAPLFRSLSRKEDIPFLEKWLSLCDKKGISLPENAYVCIIQFFASICEEKEALKYVNTILEKGLQIRCRDYVPLLSSVSKRGDTASLQELIEHMRSHNIVFEEFVFNYLLNTFINARDPDGFLRTIDEMMKSIEVLQDEESVKTLERFCSLWPRWHLRECRILQSGVCSICGSSLTKQDLTLVDKQDIARKVEHLIEERSKESGLERLHNFHEFQAFLKEHGPFDILVDGANIAHYKQNFDGGDFNYDQIDLLCNDLLAKKYRILIVLHEHHFGKTYTRLPETWLEKGLAFKVVRGNNDDWYWMYAAMVSPKDTMILSNDQMRDHFFQIDNDKRFQVWREHNQIYYDIWTTGEKKEFKFIFPRCYTQRIQRNGDSYHFPCGKIEENMKYIQKYLCMVDTKPCSRGCFAFWRVCSNNDGKDHKYPSGAVCAGAYHAQFYSQ